MTQLSVALQDCQERIAEDGWGVEECLRRYPDVAAELRELLSLALLIELLPGDIQPPESLCVQRFAFARGGQGRPGGKGRSLKRRSARSSA